LITATPNKGAEMSVSVKERRAHAVIRSVSSTDRIVENSVISLNTLTMELGFASRGFAEEEVEINEYLEDYYAECVEVLAKVAELNQALAQWRERAADATNAANFYLGV
jgi:hypothetical protein